MAIVAVSLAFLAADQMAFGLLRGEQTAMLSLFAMSLAIIISLGGTPLGPLMTVILLGIILRRALSVPENHELRLAAT
jgi:hypothetical protein